MKKQNKIFWGVGIVLIGIILFEYSQPFVILPIGQIEYTSTTLVQDLEDSTIYKFSWSLTNNGPTSETVSLSYDNPATYDITIIQMTDSSAMFYVDLQEDTYFVSNDFDIPAWLTLNYGTPNESITSISLNPLAECKAVRVGPRWIGNTQGNCIDYGPGQQPDPNIFGVCDGGAVKIYTPFVTCRISGQIECPQDAGECKAKIQSGWINAKIYAQGYNPPCIENWECSDFNACANSIQSRTCTDLNNCGTVENRPALTQQCEESQTEQPETYYRLSNNSCSQVSILPSSKTSNDYSTLEICRTHIVANEETNQDNNQTDGDETIISGEPKNYNLYLIIAVVGILLGIIIWRRKK